jgi:hypothetical protein
MGNENSEPTTSVDRVVHTPGPWKVANNSRSVLAGPVKINQQGGPAAQSAAVLAVQERELMANAKLIAAAPDLLAALRSVRAELCRRHSHLVVDVEFAQINEAIRKATS